MTAARAARPEDGVGCVLARATGVLVVLTDHGPVRASYGAAMLGAIARNRATLPAPGEWVTLRWWPDGPVTVEGLLSTRDRGAPRLAAVLPLRPRHH